MMYEDELSIHSALFFYNLLLWHNSAILLIQFGSMKLSYRIKKAKASID